MMDGTCKVCGNEDLYSAVTGDGVCAICTMKFFGGIKPNQQSIASVRAKLGVADGEFFKQDCGAEARRILGR
jgi:uncharacterized Zn finger protein (UPF0148 family)